MLKLKASEILVICIHVLALGITFLRLMYWVISAGNLGRGEVTSLMVAAAGGGMLYGIAQSGQLKEQCEKMYFDARQQKTLKRIVKVLVFTITISFIALIALIRVEWSLNAPRIGNSLTNLIIISILLQIWFKKIIKWRLQGAKA